MTLKGNKVKTRLLLLLQSGWLKQQNPRPSKWNAQVVSCAITGLGLTNSQLKMEYSEFSIRSRTVRLNNSVLLYLSKQSKKFLNLLIDRQMVDIWSSENCLEVETTFSLESAYTRCARLVLYMPKLQSPPNPLPELCAIAANIRVYRRAVRAGGDEHYRLSATYLSLNRYILTVVDHFTKHAEVYALPDQEAPNVARAFLNEFVSSYGVPYVIHTNQWTNFESYLFKNNLQFVGNYKDTCEYITRSATVKSKW